MLNHYQTKESQYEEILECLDIWASVDSDEEQIASDDKHFYWNSHAGAYKLKSEIDEWLDGIDLFTSLVRMACAIDDSGIQQHKIGFKPDHTMILGHKFDFTKDIAGRLAECIDAICEGNLSMALDLYEELIDELGPDHESVISDHEDVIYH